MGFWIFGNTGNAFPTPKVNADFNFASPFEDKFYRYEKQVDELIAYRQQIYVLDTKGRAGKKLTVDEQMARKKLLAAIDSRLSFIAGSIKKKGDA